MFTGSRWSASIAALALWLGQAGAQPVEVYRCLDDQGRVSLQDRPCPLQTRQERRRLPRPPPAAPLRVAAPDSALSPEPPHEPQRPRPPPPPPPLWTCRNFKGEVYESETGYTRPRCVPLGVLRSDIPLGSPAAALCQWVEDDCRRLDDVAACARWREKLPETRRELRFAASDRTAGLRAEIARIEGILRESCRGD